ncbi:MAG: hypothetical protein D4R39_02260 [Methylophilaceae bacterium]|nr:MAG: hypothetical protein D4R39_02260 [Methylophilaceae bacterium]
MNPQDTKSLLLADLDDLKRMAAHLGHSLERCDGMDAGGALDDLSDERVEAFTSRFARTADLLVNKTLRSLDQHELESPGSMLDVLQRAEKRGIISSAKEIRLIKNLRNAIAHDYAGDNISETFKLCRQWTPVVLKVVTDLDAYVARLPE